MKAKQGILIEELLHITRHAITSAEAFKELSEKDLNFKKDPGQWSILECLEHLNLYGDFYLPEMEKQLLQGPPSNRDRVFKSGIIGNYFANLMKIDHGKIKKMKSPKDKNPINSKLSVLVIDRFLKQAEKLILLLNMAGKVDLTKTKASISLTKLIKLRMGDTFRFYVYHIDRHILQAQKNVKSIHNEEQSILHEPLRRIVQ
ncbi:MAG: DinB family protein [Ginsengibacter sp.]